MAQADRGTWGSRWGFILAASGSAVGLGNIWKFPYITGENGGGLFVLIYLVCIVLVGVPIMMAEILIGRAAQKQPIAAFRVLQGGPTGWATIGWLGVAAGFVILSYYVVVAGWAMDYALKSVVNFTEPIEASAQVEAKQYRVSTPTAAMRRALAETRGQRQARDRVYQIRQEARPSVWEAFELYQEALDGVGGGARAEALLLEDDELRARVELARPLQERIDDALQAAFDEATRYYAQRSELEVRDEAEVTRRREYVAERVGAVFMGLAMDGWAVSFWAALFMIITIMIVAAGVSGGIERTCKVLMPTLITLICVMVVYGMFQPGFGQALAFVFKPDATRLKASGVLEALGHAFFTLSLGMGAMITYGSYQKTSRGLVSQSLLITLFDTLIALLACMMIFPITYSYGQEPAAGPGLVFIGMPLAFAEIGQGGMLLAILFFGLLVFAALTSAISLLEVVSSYLIDQRGWPRRRAAWTVGILILLFGMPSAWSMSPGFSMDSWEAGYGKNFFDTMDYVASNWMLPLGGLGISIYAGWVLPARLRQAQMEDLSKPLILGWLLLVRFIAPILVILVLIQKVKILSLDDLLHELF